MDEVGPDTVIGSGEMNFPDGRRVVVRAFGDGRREEAEVENAATVGVGAAGRSLRAVAKKR